MLHPSLLKLLKRTWNIVDETDNSNMEVAIRELIIKQPDLFSKQLFHLLNSINHLNYFFEVYENQITALQENEALLRNIVQSIKEGLVITNKEDVIIYANNSMSEISGYTHDELINKPFSDLIANEKRDSEYKNKVKERLAGKADYYEIEAVRKDGSIRIFKINAYPYVNDKGVIIGTIGDITDVTEQKKAEEQLKKNEKKYRDVVNYSLALVCTHDMKGNILSINPACAAALQMSETELQGMNIKDFIAPQHRDSFDHYLHRINENKTDSGIMQIVNKSGERMYLMYQNYKVDDVKENPYVTGFAQDITKRLETEEALKKAKQQAEESVKAKEIFLANMSHEIRTPLNVIMGMGNILSKTGLNQKQINYLNTIKSSAENLLVIINDILDISKATSGKLTFEHIGFEIEPIIKSLITRFVYKAAEKDMYISHNIDEGCKGVLLGDPLRLNQVLMNLLSNAIKFTEQGKISITCKSLVDTKERVTILFAVRDTGIGIPADKIDTIFESFTQADTSITRKFGGTGLGLAISKQLVELQGGEIHVESQPNIGTTFYVTLTFPRGSQKDLKKKDSLEEKEMNISELEGVFILLVEDNELNRLVARTALEAWKCKIDAAENGYMAIEKLKQNDYDIVLMDVRMPVMDGIEATKYIRDQLPAPISQLPIIALTANASKEEIQQCMDVGMNDYVSKPFKPIELFNKLVKQLKKSSNIKPTYPNY